MRELIVQCGPVEKDGKRLVLFTYGSDSHRERINTDDAWQRKHARERAIPRLGFDEEAHEELEELIIQAADREDARAESQPLFVPQVICMADLPPLETDWLWDGVIPLGMLSIFDGEPGSGKSQATMDLAARGSRGDCMPPHNAPDDTYPRWNTLILSAEDDPQRQIRPRLDAAGADVRRIHFLRAMNFVDGGDEREIRLPLDVDAIANAAKATGSKLLIMDPFTAHLDEKVNTNSDHSVRTALMPLARMAETTQCAVVIVRHLNKKTGQSAMQRGGGSTGIIATCRAGYLVGRDPDDPDVRVMACTKMNPAKFPPSLAFRIVPVGKTSRVEWVGAVEMSADELVSTKGKRGGKVEHAKEIIAELLELGPRGEREVKAACEQAGLSRATYWRARKDLGVLAEKTDFRGEWLLSMPSTNGHSDHEF